MFFSMIINNNTNVMFSNKKINSKVKFFNMVINNNVMFFNFKDA